MFQTKLVEKIKTHLKFKNFFFFENRAVCVKIRKNVVERGWPHDNIIRRMHFLIFRTRLKRRTFHWAGRLMLSAQPYVSSPPLPWRNSPQWARASLLSRLHNHTQTHHTWQVSSGRVINPTQGPLPDNTQHSQQTDINALDGIRILNPSKRAIADLRLRQRQPMYSMRIQFVPHRKQCFRYKQQLTMYSEILGVPRTVRNICCARKMRSFLNGSGW